MVRIDPGEPTVMRCDDAPFAAQKLIGGEWEIVTSHSEPLGGRARDAEAATVALTMLESTFRQLEVDGLLKW